MVFYSCRLSKIMLKYIPLKSIPLPIYHEGIRKKKLKNSNCIRVHRSYIVNIDKIDSIKKDALMINDKTIPIGVTYQKS